MLLRRKWLIIVAVGVAVTVGVLLSTLSTKVYAATAEIVVGTQGGGETETVATHVEILKSEPVAVEVSRQLGEAAQVVSAIRIKPKAGTRIIRITTESSERGVARRAANTFAGVYIENRRLAAVNGVQETGRVLLQRVQQAKAQLDDIDSRMAAAGRTAAELQALRNQRDTIAAQHALFQQRYDQSVNAPPAVTNSVEVLREATVPSDPIRPRPVRNALLALVLGLLVGAAAAFMFEFFADRVKTIEDVERQANGKEILGTIPIDPEWVDTETTRLVTLEPDSAASDAYRSLSTSLQFIGMRRPLRTLLFTSPMSGEGASTTLANLAVTLARSGRRVVCVDCDLRRPRLHEFFGLPTTIGFTSVLLGDHPMSVSLQTVPLPDGASLRLLASGPLPPDPDDLFGTARVAELLTAVSADADVVLIDAPALLAAGDAAALATRVAGVVVVATADLTAGRDLNRALDMLDNAGANALGIVLNGVSDPGEDARYESPREVPA